MYKPRKKKKSQLAQSLIEYIILFAIVVIASVALFQRAPSIFSAYRDKAIKAIL